ncbi:MAG: 3-dehydroquinate dehydratase [Candidatus Dormibacteraeota bacterium]|nr:3-dehydroquinate dehydratase [Candidatus Dormibacteraeota bacterium]
MTRILVLNGPNLGSLGTREPKLYGTVTLSDIESLVRERAAELGVILRLAHSNHEGELIDILEAERARADGCVVNPGGLSHTSIALTDALRAFGRPVIEVHITNVFAREPERRVLLTAAACAGVITGLGVRGYVLALDAIMGMLRGQPMMETTA